MFSSDVAERNKSVVTMLCFSLGLLAASAAVSQEPEVVEFDVVGGNSSNSLMFGLKFGVGDGDIDEAITLNTDANAYPSLNSFTFLLNTCGESRTDIVAASTNASRLVIYAGGQGAGASICGEPGQECPPRPVGLSTSLDGKVSVATSGASGTTPGVFTFTAGNDESTCAMFSRSGGDLSATLDDGKDAGRLRAIADTEFVRADVGELEAGDLLVLVSNPAMIVRVTPDGIGPSGASGTEFANSLSAFSGYRRATPTGLAIVPGETPNVLVTLSTGAIVNFYYRGTELVSKPFDTGGLFPNPRGIGAGTREGVPYIVVSEQNRGRYIRVEVQEDTINGGLKRSTLPGAYREIVSPVGAPEGVAVSQEDPEVFVAQKCFNPESEEPTGCNFGPGDLHFSQGFEGGLEGESLRFDVTYIPDPTVNPARVNGLLRLPHPCDGNDTCAAQDFFVPASCRGYDTTGADPTLGFGGIPQLVLVDIDLLNGFFVTSGNFAQVTERVKDTLGVDAECTETGARVYYHPSKDLNGIDLPGGTLFDVTVSCQNPSRGISELLSPVVFCVDPNYVARKTNPEAGRNEFVNPNIRIFIEDLKAAVAELGNDFPALSSELNSLLVGFTNPDMGAGKVPGYYVDTWKKADEGALRVLELKRDDAFAGAGPRDLYARLLRGFLGLAFYAKETGLAGYDGSAAIAAFELGDAGVKYYPPAEFCRRVVPYNEYPSGSGDYFPELQDVECDCTGIGIPDPLEGPSEYTCAPGTGTIISQ